MCRRIISILLSYIIIFTTIAITPFDVLATDNITEKNIIIFENADFWQNKWDFRVHIVLFTADLDNHTFIGLFYVDNGATFQKEITGSFNRGNILGSDENYEYHLVFSVPDQYGGNYTLDFSNSLGRMEGTADGFSNYNWFQLLIQRPTVMNGPQNSGKIRKIRYKWSEDDMKMCMDFSANVYKLKNEELKRLSNYFLLNDNNYSFCIPYNLSNILGTYNNVDDDDVDLLSVNYDDDNKNNVAYTITNRKNQADGTVDIIVIIRGTLDDEWQGNTEITGTEYDENKSEHDNFYKAKNSIKEGIQKYYNYISDTYSQNQINLIITGHSRGAAVANIYAKEATDVMSDISYPDIPKFNSVTAYTFACPNVRKYYIGMESYSNISNYCLYEDIVPTVPPTNPQAGWDYWKFGKTYNYTVHIDWLPLYYDDFDFINYEAPAEIGWAFSYWENVDEYYNKYLISSVSEFNPEPSSTTLYNTLHDATGLIKSKNKSRQLLSSNNFYNKLALYPELIPFAIAATRNILSIIYAHSANSYNTIIQNEGSNDFELCSYEYITDTALYERFQKIETPLTITYNETEVSILRNLANTPSNLEKLGWDLNDPSTWEGIYWDSYGHVYGIDLSFKYITGVLPLDEFPNLKYLYLSGNNLILQQVDFNLVLEEVDCSCNDYSNSTFPVKKMRKLKKLKCDNCGLTNLDLQGLKDLEEVSFSFNNINDFNIDEDAELETLKCEYNKFQIDNNNSIGEKIQDFIDQGTDVSYYPQWVSDNATFNSSEINALKTFAQINDNNDALDWLDNNNNIDTDKLQKNVLFEYDGADYRIVAIDIANLEVEGALNLSSFNMLRDLFCENTNITSLNLSGCTELETLECSNSEISSLTLPSNASSSTSELYELRCQNNHIDINIFTESIINQIEQKDDYTLYYKHQLIDGQVNDFDSNDYTSLINIYNQLSNSDVLEWNISKPGYFDYVDWKYDSASGKYKLLNVYFDCLNIKGNADFSSSTGIDEISFSGSNINTVELPAVYISADAFYDCPRLEAVVLGSGTLSISDDAFKHCQSLQGVYVPNTVINIGENAFGDCDNVKLAGEANSYVESYAQTNSIPFETGYFVCGNVVAKQTSNGGHSGHYPVESASVSEGDNTCETDRYGYYVSFGADNGSHTFDLTYPYGWDLEIDTVISNAPMIVTTAIPMVICDYNTDGYINGRDYAFFKTANVQVGDTDFKYYDINKDGIKNNNDWQAVWGLLGEERPNIQQELMPRTLLRVSPQRQYKNNTESRGIEIIEGSDD